MKARVATFSLKVKEDIWWEDLKSVRDINEEYLSWNKFEWLFKNNCLLERYTHDREK